MNDSQHNDICQNYHVTRQVIAQRKTLKVLAAVNHPVSLSAAITADGDQVVKMAIADAGMAPFHYDRNVDQIAEPWRVHWIGHSTCRRLSHRLGQWFELKSSNKLPAMLAACGSLVLVNWIPQFRQGCSGQRQPDPNLATDAALAENQVGQVAIDDEHLAATAAYVQNLLLLLTAAGLGTYWSSGGQLALPLTFQRLNIGHHEKLLAAVFVDYLPLLESATEPVERMGGKHRDRRSEVDRWATFHEKLMD